MKTPGDAAEYVSALLASPKFGPQAAHHRIEPGAEPVFADCKRPWPKAILDLMAESGAKRLYSHQALAADLIRSGKHVIAATPTASGKSLIYNLPVIERFLQDPESRSLYLFPLKALAQDQLKTFNGLTSHWPKAARPQAAIYDGDTTAWFRKKIRENPPNVLMTNPEMLHLSLLAHHEKWTAFLAGLSFVVVDEVHTYRGVLGSHMAQVFRRLARICARYGAAPTFVFCSATIGNPAELANQLTGLDVECVTKSGAPKGKRNYVFINPELGAAQAAIQALRSALARELRTIVYTQSRKMAELISLWAAERAGGYAGRISPYRAGFLPEERREIEKRMTNGDLLAVISTSALELGIDIGGLDICILVGYPGTVMSTLQRGGRVGRGSQESAVLLIAHEDALDQYFMRNPDDFFNRPPESAVLNPHNPVILARHLECAAAEQPLRADEPWLSQPETQGVVKEMEARGELLRSREGDLLFSPRKNPHRHVDLRSSGRTYTIQTMENSTSIGLIDERRAFRETHQGAVYLHRGESHVVKELDLETRTIRVQKARTDYYTRIRSNKNTEILEVLETGRVWGARVGLGRLRVTENITGYEKRRIRGQTLLNIIPLDLPPEIFETEGLWIEIPRPVREGCEKEFLHFMGGIHALEHAAIGIAPLLVMTDRNDLGGISTPMHSQLSGPAVFIYDGAPGGVGLSRSAFSMAGELFAKTLSLIAGCPCELGCPSCVHSPKCGSGNRPIDKQAALFILNGIKNLVPGEEVLPPVLVKPVKKETRAIARPKRYAVLDVETRRSAEEVGGWSRADRMGVSAAVLYDSARDEYIPFEQDELPRMFEMLRKVELVVGFNILRFDYKVLTPFTGMNLADLPTLDILAEVKKRLNYRLSLDSLARATLGAKKSADGLQALKWWKQGRLEKIIEYCAKDVAMTRDLYLYGRENGFLLFTNKARRVVRTPVSW